MRNRRLLRIMGITAFPFCGFALGAFLMVGARFGLTPTDVLGFVTDPNGTVWAPDYSEVAFEQIARGDSEDRVRALCGEPLTVYPPSPSFDNCSSWAYTDQYNARSNYIYRIVYFRDGTVERIQRGLCWD